MKRENLLCDQCEFKTKNKCHLKTHIESIHEGIKHYCNQCDFQSTQKHRLKTHLKSIHEGIKRKPK